jgi:large subunit ribosomal protein L24
MGRAGAPRVTKVPEIRKGDTVLVLAGRDAGKRGTVEQVIRDRQGWGKTARRGAGVWQRISPLTDVTVIVEGLNIAKRATKARQRSSAGGSIAGVPNIEPGGIIEKPLPMPIGKVMLVCPRCDQPTRVRHLTLETGARVRACAHCGQPVEVKGA